MIAENNPILTEASEKLYTYNADEAARQRSQARAEYLAHERAVNNRLAKLTEENAVLISEKQSMADEIERLRAQLAKFENSEVTK